MDLFTPLFSFTCFYGALSLVVYILTTYIIQRNHSIFSGSFFILFKASFVYNLITFTNSFVSLRVPQNTCFNCSLASFFLTHGENDTFSFPLNVFYGIQLYMVFPQYSINLLISLNRFTMFIWLKRNDDNWRRLSPFVLSLVTFFPLFFAYGLFTHRSYYKYSPQIDGFVSTTEYGLRKYLIEAVIFMTFSTTLSAIFNIASITFLSKMGDKIKKIDRTMLYVSFFSFSIELFCMALTLIIIFRDYVPIWTLSTAAWLVPYGSDLLTLSQPWILILFSSAMRSKMKFLCGCKKTAHMEPPPDNRVFSMTAMRNPVSVTA